MLANARNKEWIRMDRSETNLADGTTGSTR
jgi:hypothetical protein